MSRLARYRDLLARIEPTGLAALVGFVPGMYVPTANGIASRLATHLALRPSSTHLVVGAIGSGKTTTVRQTAKKLREQVRDTGDVVRYIDVSLRHRLDEESLLGVLIALAAKLLIEMVRQEQPNAEGSNPELLKALQILRSHADGYTEWIDVSGGDDGDGTGDDGSDDEDHDRVQVHRPGVLKAPPTPSFLFQHLVSPLSVLRKTLSKNVVLIFDSLDRLAHAVRFQEAIEHDIPVLRQAGIGVVVVGPLRFGLSKDRMVAGFFKEVHVVQTANAEEREGLDFLASVLRGRASADILPDKGLKEIAVASGGIVRDLLSLATRAAMEAYDHGHETIDDADVMEAIHAIGAAKAVGLESASFETIKRLREGLPFELERNLTMVERGQVVQAGIGKWKVHPALQRLLDSIKEAA